MTGRIKVARQLTSQAQRILMRHRRDCLAERGRDDEGETRNQSRQTQAATDPLAHPC